MSSIPREPAPERIVADVGNSAATFAVFTAADTTPDPNDPTGPRGSHGPGRILGIVTRIVHAGVDDAAFASRIARFAAGLPATLPVGIAETNPLAAARVAAALAPRRILVAPRDFAPTVKNACDPPGSVGLDRLFDAEALPREGGFVVVDAGTAITVDLVDAGTFRGGAIAPGIRLCYDALHRGTGRLPAIEPRPPGAASPPALGTNTEGAIRSGVEVGIAGLVERLIGDLRDSYAGRTGGTAEVIVTGGDAPLLLPLLRCAHRHDPTLTLRGIDAALARALAP